MLPSRVARSARWAITAFSMCLRSTSCSSGGRRPIEALLPSIQKPSQTWLVSEQYFCTSYSLADDTRVSGFSCPSTMRVCNAEYTSAKLMLVGAASSARKIDMMIGLGGTRSFIPRRSSGVATGRVLVVVTRKPLSHIRS